MSPVRIIYQALPASRRRQFWLTMILLVVSAVTETLSIGAILPFLAILTDPSRLDRLPLIGQHAAGFPHGPELAAWAAAIFISLALASGALRLVLARATQALAFNIAYDLANIAFFKMLRQDYTYYVRQHSSDLLSAFEKLHELTFSVFMSGIQALVSTFIGLLIIAFLVAISPSVAMVAAGVLIGAYVLISILAKPRLQHAGQVVSTHTTRRIKTVQEALGGIRDIILDRSQPVFQRTFEYSADQSRRAFISAAFLNIAPRIVVEMAGIAAIGFYVWFLGGREGGIAAAIPTLGALALGAQRLLPQLQQAYTGWSAAVGRAASLGEVSTILQLEDRQPPLSANAAPSFQDSIRFEGVSFRYAAGPPVLTDVDLTICKGERIGIAGPTGSGKSTLMDLLLGLLEPSAGSILIDGELLVGQRRARWQSTIAHVPQAIYLSDSSLAANIAFGLPEGELDMDCVRLAAREAGIADFIETLSEGYDTMAGERGVRLSGGQRQRIGIARALYRRPQVLILDEATSALDTATESAVMSSIDALGEDMTVIMIAHRLTTLENCDRVLRVEGGRVR